MSLDTSVWFMSHSDLGPTVVEDGVSTPITWNELEPGRPALFDSTRHHSIHATKDALLLVLYSPCRKLQDATLAQQQDLGFPCEIMGGDLPWDLEAQQHTIKVTTPAGDAHIVPWLLPQMACHLTGWLCKKYRRPDISWELWDKPEAGQSDVLQRYTYHDVILPGSELCARHCVSTPATDPRARGGAYPKFKPEMLTWEGRTAEQMLQLSTAMLDEDHAQVPQ
eukprot:4725664-Amphidinium_carterae.1